MSYSTLLCCSLAEQLVLCIKAEEFLSAALHTAKESINGCQLVPSNTVKQGEYADSSCCDSTLNICKMSKISAEMRLLISGCLHAVFPERSDPGAEWIVQDLCIAVSLPQPSLADLPVWQTEAYWPLQWADSRKAAVQPRCAHGELTSHHSPAVCVTGSQLWRALLSCSGADCSAGWNVSLWLSFTAALP